MVAIAFGKVTRSIQDVQARKWISSFGGLAIVIAVSGWHTVHTLTSVMVHTLLIKTSTNRHVHWINFVFGFMHLFFFRLCGSGSAMPWSYFAMPPSHTNAIQMIMTLKLMGLAFEVHDSEKLKAKTDLDQVDQLEKKYTLVNPTPLDIFHYSFSHSGILTGTPWTYLN